MLDLMLAPIAAGLVILALHAYLGLHVIARGVIFVDLAFAQIAALGTTVGLMVGVEHGTPMSVAFSLGFTLIGALIFSFSRLEETVVPQEALIGITYVVASAAVILIAGFTAEGAEHVAETMTGTLIWVTWPQILRDPQYAKYRERFDQILADRAANGIISNKNYIEVVNLSKDWRQLLTKKRDEYKFVRLRESIRFILRIARDLSLES